jgi:ribonuclease P protein component
MNEQFGKEYKLCSKKIIYQLFETGKRLHSFPYTVTYDFVDLPANAAPFQVVISAPKRQFKHANKRNHIKRLMRECIRKNKHVLEDFLALESNKSKQLALFIVYRHHEELDFETLMRKTSKLFVTLTTTIQQNEK